MNAIRAIGRAALAACALALLVPATAVAEEANPQEVLTKYTVKLEELKARDKRQVAVQEIGTLRAWLSEAQSYVAQEREDELATALARVRVQTRLVEALLAKDDAEQSATRAHEKADQMEREVLQVRNEAFELEQKKSELERKGL